MNEHSLTSILAVMVKNRFFHKFVWEVVENEKIQGFHVQVFPALTSTLFVSVFARYIRYY